MHVAATYVVRYRSPNISDGSSVTGWVSTSNLSFEPSGRRPFETLKPRASGPDSVWHDADIKFKQCLIAEVKRGPYSSHAG